MMTIDNGLIVDESTNPPTCAGYLFNFQSHGVHSPDGKLTINGLEITEAQREEHNRLLAMAEWAAMLKHGRGVLYRHKDIQVGDWAGVHRVPVHHAKSSFHNFAGHGGRRDFWFTLDGSLWHGVNIGDNDIVRVKRTKGQS